MYNRADGICWHSVLIPAFTASVINGQYEREDMLVGWLAGWWGVYASSEGKNIKFLLSRTKASERSLLELCNTTLAKRYFGPLVTEVGWVKPQLCLLIRSRIFHRERPITTGKQMLMRHLTFNSITLPLCSLLLCGITVSSAGKTSSLVEESYSMRQIILSSEKTHTLTITYLANLLWDILRVIQCSCVFVGGKN